VCRGCGRSRSLGNQISWGLMSEDNDAYDDYSDVTFIIPAFNAGSTLHEAVVSTKVLPGALALVVDDGSTDATAQVGAAAGATVLRQVNSGAAAARRRGLSEVHTDFVVLLDSDDAALRGMRSAVDAIRAAPNIAVVGGRARLIAPGGKVLRSFGRARTGRVTLQELLQRHHSPWQPSTAVWRAEALRAALAAEPPLLNPPFAEDFEWLLRAASVGEIVAVDEETCTYAVAGGKSFVAAVEAVQSSEQVRLHYASVFGVDVFPLSPQEVKDQVAWRLFFASRVPKKPIRLVRYAIRRGRARARGWLERSEHGRR
jgi:hypothetical protein